MKWLIRKVLSAVGWKRLLQMTWEAIHDELVKLAEKTNTEFDDKALKIIDEIVDDLIKEA